MYNFGLLKDEELIYVFDDILVKINDKELFTTVALTTKRLLFLDYNNANDELRIAKYQTYIKYKEVYYKINLDDIESIRKDKYYQILLKNESKIEFDNNKLYELLEK